ncbi:MAG: hypothetical protein GY822_10615 [Deltaproteobacteria bacterium]|nr:hypothetical protein [Deltaproteobacteria bacterium]
MKRWTFDSLAQENLATLETVMKEGTAPAFSKLVGWEFRGFNVLTAMVKPAMKVMGFTRFAKGFYNPNSDASTEDAAVDEQENIRGYNVLIQRGGLGDSWDGKPSVEQPKRHSFYQVFPPGTGERDFSDYDHALYLNYGIPENGIFDGKGIRDYVVQVDADNDDLLLGKAYMNVGPIKLHAGYFVLERWREYKYEA